MDSTYFTALEELEPGERSLVESAIAGWSVTVSHAQIGLNVVNETALEQIDFVGLLKLFAQELAAGHGSRDAWATACHNHQFRGKPLDAAFCPSILGRVTTVKAYAVSIAVTSSTEYTPEQAEQLLYRLSVGAIGSTEPLFESILRETPLGRFLIWATFNPDDKEANPFDRLPQSRPAICAALGLGHFLPEESLVTLVWDHEQSGAPTLHRPTVADAENNPFFRPHPDPTARWGATEPLPPREDHIGPQAELVMPETNGKGLKLPIRIF